MSSHRSLRVAEAIREVVASAVLFEVADPRVQGVTVLRAEVSQDLRAATVFISVMGTEADRNRAMKGIRSARGFLQARAAARLQLRFAPVLSFELDDGVRKSVEISRLINEAIAADRKPGETSDDEDLDGDDDDNTDDRRDDDDGDDAAGDES